MRMAREEVHVWRIELDRSPDEVAALKQSLNAAEVDRAHRFHFEKDRSDFLVARGSLRAVLARYLDQAAKTLEFKYGAQGKPHLEREGFSFNLSHSGRLALIAVSGGDAVGVDLEFIKEQTSGLDVARHFFSPDERQVLMSRPPAEQQQLFFTCWTRKESFIKAAGGGLSMPLAQFDVLWPGLQGCGLRQRGTPVPGNWSINDLHLPDQGYAAALTVDLCSPVIRCWNWNEQ